MHQIFQYKKTRNNMQLKFQSDHSKQTGSHNRKVAVNILPTPRNFLLFEISQIGLRHCIMEVGACFPCSKFLKFGFGEGAVVGVSPLKKYKIT